MNHLAQLPFLPISLHILSEAPFFASKNSDVVRAGFLMMEAAWRSSRPGSIPSSFSELSIITRLSSSDVESNYTVLTAGWDLLDDGRLHHSGLSAICCSIQERFGAQLEVIADAAVVAIQGGSAEFELTPSSEVLKKKRGKHLLPKDFSFDKTTTEHALHEGFTTPELQQWLSRSFADYASARNVMYTNWQAACRNYISSDITRKTFLSKFGHLPGQGGPSVLLSQKSSAADRLRMATQGTASTALTFQQRTTIANSEKMHKQNRFMPAPPAPQTAVLAVELQSQKASV